MLKLSRFSVPWFYSFRIVLHNNMILVSCIRLCHCIYQILIIWQLAKKIQDVCGEPFDYVLLYYWIWKIPYNSRRMNGRKQSVFQITIELLLNANLHSAISGFTWNYNLNDSVLGIREQTDGITRVEYLNFKSSMDEYRMSERL